VIVCDTGPLVAAALSNDPDNQACTELFTGLHLAGRRLLIPATVVAEVGYLLCREAGARVEAAFLRYMAGIHASGGAGAAYFLDREPANLFKEARTSRWSCLVRCEYDAETFAITGAELAAPIHVPGKGTTRARKPR
jgi:predicted nucleic acid-binding protein